MSGAQNAPAQGEVIARLYHFTSAYALPQIRAEGLKRGDVPIGPNVGFNSPWLTADPEPGNQPWMKGSPVDKAAIRITVDVPDGEPRLHTWTEVVQTFAVPERSILTTLDGRENWCVMENHVPAAWFVAIEGDERRPPLPSGALATRRYPRSAGYGKPRSIDGLMRAIAWDASAERFAVVGTVVRTPDGGLVGRPIGRSAACPCGSGEKYKRCCEGV